jgi:hypothetical protein
MARNSAKIHHINEAALSERLSIDMRHIRDHKESCKILQDVLPL